MSVQRSGVTYKVEVRSKIDGERILEDLKKDLGPLLRR